MSLNLVYHMTLGAVYGIKLMAAAQANLNQTLIGRSLYGSDQYDSMYSILFVFYAIKVVQRCDMLVT